MSGKVPVPRLTPEDLKTLADKAAATEEQRGQHLRTAVTADPVGFVKKLLGVIADIDVAEELYGLGAGNGALERLGHARATLISLLGIDREGEEHDRTWRKP